MAELDELTPNYRRAQRRWPDAPSLAQHYNALASCFVGGGFGLVEHVKSFLESVCVTIMGELREPMPSSAPSTTELLVAALGPLGLRNTKGSSKLDKVLSGFNRLADALADMRNETGPVAHGKDGFLDAVRTDHARAFLAVGDAIVGLLLNALEGREPDLSATREPYESFPHLNERIDRAVSVVARVDEDGDRAVVVFSVAMGPRGEVIELRVEPSRLLYGIDREAYIEVLKSADLAASEAEDEDEISDIESTQATKIVEIPWVTTEPGPQVVFVSKYTGRLELHREGLVDFLKGEKVSPRQEDSDGNFLVDSLLATIDQNAGLDWTERARIQARLKVACKRAFVHFGLDAPQADEIAGRLMVWLRVQAGSRLAEAEVPADVA
ncbi:abortive infection family protein [Elongatibacter sediminis]|uniref:Abortive infection family protein n=1 Tax=Elongatibacter sediminis TaxID=3119006 RepID=A0AAW9REV1_9GAMM